MSKHTTKNTPPLLQRLFPRLRWASLTAATVLFAACVTINVYFPAAEAETAAGKLVEEIIGDEAAQAPQDSTKDSGENPQGALWQRLNPVNWVIPVAQARANIDISSPAINEIKQRMKQRYAQYLKKWLDQGIIGFNNQGFVEILAVNGLGLKERQLLKKVVADENRDRKALYRELAVANGHPEWEEEIRQVFVKQWIAKAHKGWHYQKPDGTWAVKA
jgi:uncharacterized protein YdbL (DUF1318 family)